MKKLVIFDANAVIHRAYHAIPPLTTKKGETINAAYGFTMILLKVLSELKPDYVACAFDLKGLTFRHKEYKEYKATRQKAPDDLLPQFDRIKEILSAMNIPVFEKEGFEADDIIGTISRNVKDVETVIVTGDLDELQLVDDNTRVYTMRRGFTDTVIYDKKAVFEKYGLTPEEFIEYKALKGDPSDNIPGVPGIGEKTASTLIQKYKDLDGLYKNLDDQKPGVKKSLEENKEQAYLSKMLSTIVCDVKIDFDLKNAETGKYDRKKVIEIFRELEFRTLLSKLPELGIVEEETGVDKKQAANGNYSIIRTKEDLEELLKKIKQKKLVSFDTETTSVDAVAAELVGLCFSIKEKEGYYVPVGHKEVNSKQLTINKGDNELKEGQLDFDYVISKVKPILEDKDIQKIGHNIKYDYKVLEKYGIRTEHIHFDTMIAAYLLDPNARAQKLQDLSIQELGVEMIPITDLIGKGKNQLCFDEVDIDDACQYAAEDADITLRLYNHLRPRIEEEGLSELFEDMEMPLTPILADMELSGIKIDSSALNKMSKEFEKRIETLDKSICKLAGARFNVGSPAQLKEILFDKLNLAVDPEIKKRLKRLKTGGYSTAASELDKLRGLHPIIDLISEYREVAKLKSTYVDALPLLINKRTGRVHTSYNQAATATGRLSSSDPNLQNIPIRTDLGNEIRKAFIAEKRNKLLAADYSQIELRIVAHISNDEKMLEAFRSDEDIHTRTAALVFGVKDEEVTSNMRRAAKVVNFGVLYGMSPHGLSEATGMEHHEAAGFIDKYFEVHKGIKKYVEETKEVARELGYVETIFGRRRNVPEIHSSNFIVKNAAERVAVNMPVQGSAADLMKMAMIDISKQLADNSKQGRMLLQVHDELVFEVPEKEVSKVAKFVKEKMETVVSLKVPIEVKLEVGDNWGEMREI